MVRELWTGTDDGFAVLIVLAGVDTDRGVRRSARPDPVLPHLDGYEVDRVPGVPGRQGLRVSRTAATPIAAADGHVVAWPEGLVDDRRHWHLHCWRLAASRGR